MSTATTHAREIARNALKALHDTHGHTWHEITQIYPFLGIPPGTMSAIASGQRNVPSRYISRFKRYDSLHDIPTDTLKLMLENRYESL